VSVYTPSEYANDGSQYDGVFLSTITGLGHSVCQLTNAELHNEFAATVGTPVVVAFRIGTSVQTGVLPLFIGLSSLAKYVLSMNALNTATLEITSADGAPLTGQSGKTYGPPGPLPTVTTSSTVTTTSSAPPTTTTLAGCAGTCGDGTADAACGETCDCAATADPIQTAYGCDGAAIVPPQESCVTCRGCRLLEVRCEQVVPVTTTTTVAGQTTTSLAGGATTTTLPAACAGTAGLAAAACVIDAFLTEPLCTDAAVPAKIESGFRKKLGAVRTTLGRAESAGGKKRVRLLRGAGKKLGGIAKRADNLAPKKISDACAVRIEHLVDRVTNLIAD
jgi:hypothetical protein